MSELAADCTNQQLVRIKEASRITGYKPSTIYVFVHRKEIPFLRCRGRLLFDPEKLNAWLKSQMVCHG